MYEQVCRLTLQSCLALTVQKWLYICYSYMYMPSQIQTNLSDIYQSMEQWDRSTPDKGTCHVQMEYPTALSR